jgi:hypothetical protein
VRVKGHTENRCIYLIGSQSVGVRGRKYAVVGLWRKVAGRSGWSVRVSGRLCECQNFVKIIVKILLMLLLMLPKTL